MKLYKMDPNRPKQVAPRAEDIVRALFASDPLYDEKLPMGNGSYLHNTTCALCQGEIPYGHDNRCPWWLAQLWVEEHPIAFKCPSCGHDCSKETERLYSAPLQIKCPSCAATFDDPLDKIPVLNECEARAKRPALYADTGDCRRCGKPQSEHKR